MTRFQVPGGTNTKKDRSLCEACAKTPDWLFDVENEIDDALGTERWILERRSSVKPLTTRIDREA